MSTQEQHPWEDFLNPDTLRSRLVTASVYLAAFEVLKEAITGRIWDFFTTGIDQSGDIISPDYESKVVSLNRSLTYASLSWLKAHKVIDEADIETFNRVKDCRNLLAHELFSLVGGAGLPADFASLFSQLVSLLRKIEVWWVANVEIPISPNPPPEGFVEEDIVPGTVLMVQMLCDIALGDEKTSGVYHEMIRRKGRGVAKV